jgi:hypothetical protein
MQNRNKQKRQPVKDLTQNPTIITVNQIMAALEAEIAQIKSGELSESKARLVARHRALELKTVDQHLSRARLAARFGLPSPLEDLSRHLGIPVQKAEQAGTGAKQVQATK